MRSQQRNSKKWHREEYTKRYTLCRNAYKDIYNIFTCAYEFTAKKTKTLVSLITVNDKVFLFYTDTRIPRAHQSPPNIQHPQRHTTPHQSNPPCGHFMKSRKMTKQKMKYIFSTNFFFFLIGYNCTKWIEQFNWNHCVIRHMITCTQQQQARPNEIWSIALHFRDERENYLRNDDNVLI